MQVAGGCSNFTTNLRRKRPKPRLAPSVYIPALLASEQLILWGFQFSSSFWLLCELYMIYFKIISTISELPDTKRKISISLLPWGFQTCKGKVVTVSDRRECCLGPCWMPETEWGWPTLWLGSWAQVTLVVFIAIKTLIWGRQNGWKVLTLNHYYLSTRVKPLWPRQLVPKIDF